MPTQLDTLYRYVNQLNATHKHSTSDGSSGINTDLPIKSRVRLQPPFIIQSRAMVKRLNAERWGGYKVGDANIPFIIQNVAMMPAFGTPGRIVWFGAAAYVDTGSSWVALALEGAIDWSNILDKPSTFPPSTHASTHESGGDDEVYILQSQVSNFFQEPFWSSIPDLPSTFPPSTHSASAHSGSIIPAANQNFQEYQALALRVENVATLPAAGNLGRVAFQTSDNKLYYDNGSTWVAW